MERVSRSQKKETAIRREKARVGTGKQQFGESKQKSEKRDSN